MEVNQQKNRKKEIAVFLLRAVLTGCAAFGWWGALYPSFTLTPDTVRIVNEDAVTKAQAVVESDFDGQKLYWDILDADLDQVHIKSKVFEVIRRSIHESED